MTVQKVSADLTQIITSPGIKHLSCLVGHDNLVPAPDVHVQQTDVARITSPTGKCRMVDESDPVAMGTALSMSIK